MRQENNKAIFRNGIKASYSKITCVLHGLQCILDVYQIPIMTSDITSTVTSVFLLTILLIRDCQCWPEGTYGLPMPKAGCPSTKEFEWLTGSRTQKTEPESHASTPIHLAGVESEQTDRIVQNFCMKTSYPQYGNYHWEKGSYCIFKKGDCPKDFKPGWIYWDDAAPFFGMTIQNLSGAVPDGEYDRNTKIHFCCRKDGSVNNHIVLPTDAPFYLFKISESCQMVKNTKVTEEWVYWADEEFVNLSGQGGLHPKLHRSKYPFKFIKLYYCYYVPEETRESYKTLMTVIYCISGIVSLFILIFVATLLIQKCCTHKPSTPYDIHDSGAEEAMIESEQPRTQLNMGAFGTEMAAMRHNGAIPHDSHFDSYPVKGSTSNRPPRYSQLEGPNPSAPPIHGAECVSPSLMEPESPTVLPPSYDEVIKEKQTENI